MVNADEVLPKEASQDETNPLLTPFQLGSFKLAHRVVMAPLSRCRSYNGLPQPGIESLYYSQRATPGGLIITGAAGVSEDGNVGYPHMPGIWTAEQVEAWKPIVKAVHDKGAFFFVQLWHAGRASHVDYQPNKQQPVSSSSRRIENAKLRLPSGNGMAEYSQPRALETHEIATYVDYFRKAARNAIEAGFDGVEVHAANGYLIEQFLKDGTNDRTDEYGGSLENRARFALEVVEAVAAEIGAGRVGVRLSLFADLMESTDSNPSALGLHLAKELSKLGILYAHHLEPMFTPGLVETELTIREIRNAFGGAFLSNGGHTRASGIEAIRSGAADAVAYGKDFVANPDLVRRFELNAPLNNGDPSTWQTQDPVVGYTDYPFLEDSFNE